ncbi:MAG: hypothetical protein K9N09_08345 [Candidatus Cloacimonetes bacterium]|nr:hypothetical protein [Candidatus Cloacimonadota bacterium]MCF7813523.1 hypothetical protein [Candidatus Cloacimonadota bacterium]MCF7868693.1 hypothetical protein [Candidatus Cloacimonadota bacterium]MCF7884659.1 hypothetical protein [Candidatus Cloacimonadota bacterium]
MKKSLRMLLGFVILASILLSACAPPPPPVTKDQLDIAEQEAIAAEEAAADQCAATKEMEAKVSAKQAELDDLKNYKNELEARK